MQTANSRLVDNFAQNVQLVSLARSAQPVRRAQFTVTVGLARSAQPVRHARSVLLVSVMICLEAVQNAL